MKNVFLVCLFAFISACALIEKRVEVHWPTHISYMEGEGDLDLSWKKEKYSGSFSLKMAYPDLLLLEVYGPFGQTVLYVKKEPNQFLFIAGEEKTADESVFEEAYGFKVRQLIDDLAMEGQKDETTAGVVIRRQDYQVIYSQDRRNNRKICWDGKDGRICLTFTEISFDRQ